MAPPTSLRESEQTRGRLRTAIILIVVGWTYGYNVLIKEQGPVQAFFRILDTISDDFVMGAVVAIIAGIGIVIFFSLTKLYTQIIANAYSFRILEIMIHSDLRHGHVRDFCSKLLHFEDQPQPEGCCPQRVSSVFLAFSFLYVMSALYVVLFSEALFFVSWSAGVNLDVTENSLLHLPTLALAVQFSARVMAYLRYRYAQDYADFLPGAVFVLLVVASLGWLFESDDQAFFLKRVFSNRDFTITYLHNGAFLAFIPVFFEAGFWLYEIGKQDRRAAAESSGSAFADAEPQSVGTGSATENASELTESGTRTTTEPC